MHMTWPNVDRLIYFFVQMFPEAIMKTANANMIFSHRFAKDLFSVAYANHFSSLAG